MIILDTNLLFRIAPIKLIVVLSGCDLFDHSVQLYATCFIPVMVEVAHADGAGLDFELEVLEN